MVLIGCGDLEAGAAGSAGSAGVPGAITFNTGVVSGAELEAAFALSGTVIIGNAVQSVDGVVPAGKKFVVSGATAVTDAKSLEVLGTLEIAAKAGLNASYVSGTAGCLKGSAAGITGAGTVSLPYVGTSGSLPAGGIGYTTAGVAAVKTAGSYITGSVPGSALDKMKIEVYTLCVRIKHNL